MTKTVFRRIGLVLALVWAVWFIAFVFVIFPAIIDYCRTLMLKPQFDPIAVRIIYAMPLYCFISLLAGGVFLMYKILTLLFDNLRGEKHEDKNETDN